MKTIAITLLLLFSSMAQAGQWKFRAREHYEIHTIKIGSQNIKYKGFSNTINFWYEEPFKYSLGLAMGPVIGSAKIEKASPVTSLGDKIRLYNLGLEGKYFPLPNHIKGLFTRLGLNWNQLQPSGTANDLNGWSAYYGIGYEQLIADIGVALEAAWRHTELQDDVKINSFIPSIGFHFYKMF